jgi:ketoreductase RED1
MSSPGTSPATDETAAPRTATVIGTGTIGLGWIVLLLAKGVRVRVNSTRPDAEAHVRSAVELLAAGLPGGPADPAKLCTLLEFEPDVARAAADVDVVLENVPESLALKRELFSRIEQTARADTLLLSSTSTLPPDELAAGLRRPGRLLVGHPFNPPHVIPLVEVVPGTATDQAALRRSVSFYRAIGKHPVVIEKAVPGFVANRLQTALLREAIHLVQQGVITAPRLDEVVTSSIGLRWAVLGPFLAAHLAGGSGGLQHWLGTIGAGLQQGWQWLGDPQLDSETADQLVKQVDEGYGTRSYEVLVTERDQLQGAVLAALERRADIHRAATDHDRAGPTPS